MPAGRHRAASRSARRGNARGTVRQGGRPHRLEKSARRSWMVPIIRLLGNQLASQCSAPAIFLTARLFSRTSAASRARPSMSSTHEPGCAPVTCFSPSWGQSARAAVVPEGIGPLALQRSVAVLKPRALSPRFCMYQLQSPYVQQQLSERSRGTAQKGVYLESPATAHPAGSVACRAAPHRSRDRETIHSWLCRSKKVHRQEVTQPLLAVKKSKIVRFRSEVGRSWR